MNDRELLEAAAKAAGIDYEHPFGSRSHPEFNEFVSWNPLTDDGDALRLAVKIGIQGNFLLSVNLGGAICEFDTPFSSCETGDDLYSATRRAIVRAAAEIGKAGQPNRTAMSSADSR